MAQVRKLGVIQGRQKDEERVNDKDNEGRSRVSARKREPTVALLTSWMNNRPEFTVGIIHRGYDLSEITPPRNHSFNINLMIYNWTEKCSRAFSLFAEENPGYGRNFDKSALVNESVL